MFVRAAPGPSAMPRLGWRACSRSRRERNGFFFFQTDRDRVEVEAAVLINQPLTFGVDQLDETAIVQPCHTTRPPQGARAKRWQRHVRRGSFQRRATHQRLPLRTFVEVASEQRDALRHAADHREEVDGYRPSPGAIVVDMRVHDV